MTLDDFTIKAQDAINKAQNYAADLDQKLVDTPHLMKGLLNVDNSMVVFILEKLSIDTDQIIKGIDSLVYDSPKSKGTPKQSLTREANKALAEAKKKMTSFGDNFISVDLILLGILDVDTPTSAFLRKQGLTPKKAAESIIALRKGQKITAQSSDNQLNALGQYATNLNKAATKGEIMPVIGRDEEIRRLLQIMSRQHKNNPLLVGEPGVGKLDIIKGIALRIVDGDVPEKIKSQKIFSLDLTTLVAGAKYKGEFEERLKSVIDEVTNSNGEIILFINDLHDLVKTGGNNAMSAINILKPALTRGDLRLIGATTPTHFQRYIERDPSLVQHFQIVDVAEPSVESALSILRAKQEKLQNYHHITYQDEALVAAIQLSKRYITNRFLPAKAVDLIDEAGAKLRLELDSVPDEIDELQRKVKQLTIEKEGLLGNNGKSKSQLETDLASTKKKLDEITQQWKNEKNQVEIIQNAKARIEDLELIAAKAEKDGDLERVAKIQYKDIEAELKKITKAEKELHKTPQEERLTREIVTAEDIAEIIAKQTGIPVTRMLDSEREKLLKLEDEISKKLIGQKDAVKAVADAVRRNRSGLQAPGHPIGSFIFLGPTGVGKTQLAKSLAEVLFNDEKAIIRLDMSEFQEAHQVSRLIGAPPGYVGYDEGGQLTEAVRRQPYAIVLLDEIEKAHTDVYNLLLQVLDDGRLTDNRGRVADFGNTIIIMTSNLGASIILDNFKDIDQLEGEHLEDVIANTEDDVFEKLKEKMPPEFLNRIDEKIMFRPLSKPEIKLIMHLMLKTTNKMLAIQEIDMTLSKKAENLLVNKGYDPQFGARPMKRAIQKELVNPLASKLIAGTFKAGDHIWVEEKKGVLDFSIKRKG